MDTSKSSLSSKFSQKPSASSIDTRKRIDDSTENYSLFKVNYDGMFDERPLSHFPRNLASYYFKNLTFDEDHGDIQSKVTSHEKLKSHGKLDLMTFDESCSWEKEQSISPLLKTPPLKKRRKGIDFQGKNSYADFLHADCVNDYFDVLDNWSYEDVYGGFFDIKDEFENEVILDDVVSSPSTLLMLLKRKGNRSSYQVWMAKQVVNHAEYANSIHLVKDKLSLHTKQKVTGIKDVEGLQVRIEELEEIFSYLRNRKLKQKEVIHGTDDETSSNDDTSLNDEISSSEDLINYLSARDVKWQLPKNT
nr:pentatricopeptide repeat-containing protein [Tanacetum cinerariifolium]